MTFAKGRGVRVEIAATYGTAKTVSEVTAANPPVATSTAHGLLAKSTGYFATAAGMPQLVGQACRLSAVSTNDFTLEDIDSTSYGDFTSGTFVPATAWVTLASAVSIDKAGGEATQEETTVLLDEKQQFEAGLLAAETVTINLRTLTISDAALALVRAAAKAGSYIMLRVTMKDGNVRLVRGQPGLPTESLNVGSIGTTSFNLTVQGYWTEGAA